MHGNVWLSPSAGLMPTEARGNYLPKPTYLRETKTYHSQPFESIRHAGNNISSRYQYGPFLFFVTEVMSNCLTTDGPKKFSLLPEAPLRPEAFATSATWLIRHCCLQTERTIAIRKRTFLDKFRVIHNALCRVFLAVAKAELESCCTDV